MAAITGAWYERITAHIAVLRGRERVREENGP
jgi:hypothetical protein